MRGFPDCRLAMMLLGDRASRAHMNLHRQSPALDLHVCCRVDAGSVAEQEGTGEAIATATATTYMAGRGKRQAGGGEGRVVLNGVAIGVVA